MATTEDKQFIDDREDAQESNINAEQEDKQTEESEVTGKIPSSEVDALKDNLGGGEVLDDSEGYTRSSNADVKPMQQEEEIDRVVDVQE